MTSPPPPDLVELVRNRTLSPEMAATLAVAAEQRRSLLMVAIPRMAGKTTTMKATLAYAPEGTAMHQLSAEHGETLGIPEAPDGGYLLMSEVSQAPMLDYLWGEPVRRVFAAASRGFPLATALHAPGLDEAIEVITGANGVPDEHASVIDLVVYIRSLGEWQDPTRRAVAEIHELDDIVDGRPRARLLHRWHEEPDEFEVVEAPRQLGDLAALEARAAEFRRAAAGSSG